MSEEIDRPDLTPDRVIYLYERQLNRTILVHFLGGFGAIAVAVAVWFMLETMWLRITLALLAILAGGMLQRLLVVSIRCPVCDGRPLARIHSIMQSRNIRECPRCGTKLRN